MIHCLSITPSAPFNTCHRDPFMLSEMESLWKIMNRGVIGSDLNSYGN